MYFDIWDDVPIGHSLPLLVCCGPLVVVFHETLRQATMKTRKRTTRKKRRRMMTLRGTYLGPSTFNRALR